MNTKILRQIFSFRMMIMLFLGYCSGLPLLLTGSTLQAWLTEAQVDRTYVGFVSLLGLPYTLKFLWSPLIDRFTWPFLGRRRGWILVSQILLVITLIIMSLIDPVVNPWWIGLIAFLVAFFSANQDIVIDAYRREIVEESELGLGSSLYVNGYRLAMIVSGAFALYLADIVSWKSVYLIMSGCMGVGILVTLISPKEEPHALHPKSIKEAVLGPLQEFFKRDNIWWMLSFILLYKVGDSMASNMTTPFILEIGYTKTDIALIAKSYGMAATIIGGLIGGVMMLKFSMKRSLIFFGILQAVSTLGFSWLAGQEMGMSYLAMVITFENLASGMGTAAYAGFMASQTNRAFTATQFALLTSLMGVPRVVLASPTGWLSKLMGWEMFFIFCTLIALPGLLLIFKLAKTDSKEHRAHSS